MSEFLLCLPDGGGSAPPLLSVASALAARGHGVRVLADPVLAPDVRATGATWVSWTRAPHRHDHAPESDIMRDWEGRTPLAQFARARDRLVFGPAGAFAADVLEELERRPADVLASEVLLAGPTIAAEAAGVPMAVLDSTIYPFPVAGVPPMGPGLLPARGPLGRARDRLLGGLSVRMWDRGLPALNAARAAHGLAPLGSVVEAYERVERFLVMTSEAFDFPAAGARPANVRYVGPRLADPAWAGEWSPPPGDAPLVLVGFSSTFQDQLPVLRRVAEALGRLPVRGLVTLGPSLDADALDAPPNVTVVASAPHREVLAHAAAVVTHAGHGTVIKALAHGVPVVALPMGRDQLDVAARLVAAGAGLRLRPRARPAAIAQAVRRVLDEPAFARAARRLAEAIARDTAEDRAVAELEGLVPAPALAAR
jgi:UDP:flavonoid glycosyltransferase YjiC (YdhE family)